jgi:hypothetical protein
VPELFEVLITRGAAWTSERNSEAGHRLDLKSWQALRGSDPTLIPVETLPGRNPMTGEEVTVEVPNSAIWTHPHGQMARFVWRDGELEANSVDELTVQKAKEIAAALGARVLVDVD